MDPIVKPYLFRASAIAGLVILLGLSLSFWVYLASDKVRDNAVMLVEKRIPTLTSINQVIADLNEQERIIYEYYGSQDGETFLKAFSDNKALLDMHQQVIAVQDLFKDDYEKIRSGQKKIETMFDEFHQAMGLQVNNWDYLRELLNKISHERRSILPILLHVESETKAIVEQAHKTTMEQMTRTHNIVISFSFSIILLGLLIAWYSKRYVIINAKNNRLALFSERNPNPILSINEFGHITFTNVACEKLLESVNLPINNFGSLLPDNFLSLREKITHSGMTTVTIEQELETRLLQININWLKDIDAYDLHIIDITETRIAEQRISDLAYLNQDTQLPNKYKMDDDINALMFSKTAFAHGMFSIKNFNRMATTQGNECSQALVNKLANLIRESLPPEVKIYQLNDNEFSLICTQSVASVHKHVGQIVEKINKIIDQTIVTENGEFFVELEFGFSFYPEHSKTRSEIIKSSRTALTFAEQDEHQQWLTFDSSWADKLLASESLLANLRLALSRNEFFLVFQPQLELASKQVVGIETLVRWRHDGNIISPVDFIPLAEQSGLIVPIGEWILREACSFAKRLVNTGHIDIVVAVNVSPRQFSHPEFCETVIKALHEVDLPAQNIELEITEGIFMHNEQEMLAVLNNLKEIGVQLSIDDFGTGYSSLSYLKQFPVNKLKIDQSFIRDCHENEEDRALVSTIVSLGKSLGLSLIAEGVEQVEHVEFLNELDCEEIQGYWYSRPLEGHDLIEFIAKPEHS